MNYGLYLSASGVLTNTYRQDVFSNNLANVETPGFKPDMPSIRQRDPESIEDPSARNVSNELMDRLGGGVLAGTQRINFAQGAHRPTGNPLDVALTDKHHFFTVETLDANTGESSVALTRDGRFTLNSAKELITQSGKRVMDAGGQPIVVEDRGTASIDKNGRVFQNGQEVAQLQVARVDGLNGLAKRGQGLFVFKGNDTCQALPAEQVNLNPGHIEASGVDAIMTMMQVVAATKAVTGNANMIKYHDQILDRAVNTLGRVG